MRKLQGITGTAKTEKKIGCLDSFIQEAIQCMRLKLWLASYDHKYFIQTEFHPILRGLVKLWLN